jgi:CzcA family heavy metal efflux pump
MIHGLISTALRLRVATAILGIVLIVVGLQVIQKSTLDVFPEFAPPLVEIQTEAPGLSTAEVEALITVPLESLLNGTTWLKTLRSKSVLGLSSVTLIFNEGTNLIQARQLVQERLSRAPALLPVVANNPVILSPLSSTSRVLKIGMTSSKLSQMEMSTVAKWTIRPRLMAIPGVANVAIWGQRDRQLQVQVDPDRLMANGVSLNEIVRATGDAVAVNGGGFIDTPNQRLAISNIPTIQTPKQLSEVVVTFRNGAPITLGDISDVVESYPPPIGDAVINGQTGLLLIVEKQPWGNTFEVTRNIEKTLDDLRPGLNDIEIDSTIFRPATFIEMSLRNLNQALLIGCLLVAIVLILFLNDWRTAVISILAIPLSLISALLILYYKGETINTMVLAGLIIALGSVVDDAIIGVENITRRLRENANTENPESMSQVVLKATFEVRSSVVYGSLIVVLVVLPVFFLEGLVGAFFAPLALSYVLAIGASLFVALTVTPALSLILLPSVAKAGKKESLLIRLIQWPYGKMLPKFVGFPKLALFIIASALGVTVLLTPLLGEEFLPKFKEYDFLMHWVEKPGTSLEAMVRITKRVSKELLSIPGVRNFGSHIGRAEVADEVVGPNFAELWISLDPKVDYDSTVQKVQEVVDGYPGMYRDLLTYLRERIKEVLTGASATIVVRIYGENLETLQSKAGEVADVIRPIEGVVDLKVQPQVLVPHVEVRFKKDAGTLFGLTPGSVRHTVMTLMQGTKVGEIYHDQRVDDVVVRGVPRLQKNVSALRSMMIETPSGGHIPFGQVAHIAINPTPNQITRESASRRIDVTCNVTGRDLGSVAREIETVVRGLDFDRGYYPEFLGEFAARQEARNKLIEWSVLVLLGIFLILHAHFDSMRLALLIFLTLPFALIGGVISVFLNDGVLSLGSQIGFITVLGIAVRNAIMLISHYRHLEIDEGVPFGLDLVIRGARERLAPILMTALTTGFALLPIVMTGIQPGQEIEHPLAVVILGGLITSTLLNLVFLPAIYLKFGPYPKAQNTKVIDSPSIDSQPNKINRIPHSS